MPDLADVATFLRGSVAVSDKITIRDAYEPAAAAALGAARLGDDCAAIGDDTGGYLLLAAEGLLCGFVDDDPSNENDRLFLISQVRGQS